MVFSTFINQFSEEKCNSPTEILQISGICRRCNFYEYPNSSRTKCISDKCTSRQILSIIGKCKTCPVYTYPDADAVKCISMEGKCEFN